jgi:hypothetical protein
MGLKYLFIYEDHNDVALLISYLKKFYFDNFDVRRDAIHANGIDIMLQIKRDSYEGLRGNRFDGILTSFDVDEIDEEQKQYILYPILKTYGIFSNEYYINDISKKIGKVKEYSYIFSLEIL